MRKCCAAAEGLSVSLCSLLCQRRHTRGQLLSTRWGRSAAVRLEGEARAADGRGTQRGSEGAEGDKHHARPRRPRLWRGLQPRRGAAGERERGRDRQAVEHGAQVRRRHLRGEPRRATVERLRHVRSLWAASQGRRCYLRLSRQQNVLAHHVWGHGTLPAYHC